MPRVTAVFAARTASVNQSVTKGGGPLCSCLFTCGNSRVTHRLGVRTGRSVRGRATRRISYFAAIDRVAGGRYGRLLSGPTSIILVGKFRSSFIPRNHAFTTGHGGTHTTVLGLTGGLLNLAVDSSALVINADNHCRFGGGNVGICLRSLGQLAHSGGLGGRILTFVGMPN